MATLQSASDAAAGSSIRARPAPQRFRADRPMTWNSMWRGRFDELLDVHIGAGECGACFRLRLRQIGFKFGGIADNAHAASAAAGGSFDDDWIADLLREPDAPPRRICTIPRDPGRIGTPAACIASRASCFRPIVRITSGLGPMNVMPMLRRLRRSRRSRSRIRSRDEWRRRW